MADAISVSAPISGTDRSMSIEAGKLARQVVDAVEEANRDDQIRTVDGLMHIVAFGESRRSHVKVRPSCHCTFSHLRIEKRDPNTLNEF